MTRTLRTAITLRMPPELAAALNAGYHRAALAGYTSSQRSYNAWLADQVAALARRPYALAEIEEARDFRASPDEPTTRLPVRLTHLLLEQCRAAWQEQVAGLAARFYPYATRPPSLNAWLVFQLGALVNREGGRVGCREGRREG